MMSVPSFPLNSTMPRTKYSKEVLTLYEMFRRVTTGCLRNTASVLCHPSMQTLPNGVTVRRRATHEPTNFDVYGKIDDIWQDRETGELIVVDYKSTARAKPEYLKPDYYLSRLIHNTKNSKRSISSC